MPSPCQISPPQLASRGIFWADFTLDDEPVMYGVTSTGNLVAFVSVAPGKEEDAARHIQEQLDLIDPPRAVAARASHLQLEPPE